MKVKGKKILALAFAVVAGLTLSYSSLAQAQATKITAVTTLGVPGILVEPDPRVARAARLSRALHEQPVH